MGLTFTVLNIRYTLRKRIILSTLSTFLKDETSYKVETIQALWSGYGEIARYYSPLHKRAVIVKEINLSALAKHPRHWQSEFAHQRKLSSYFNELNFYQSLSALTNDKSKVPMCYQHIKSENMLYLILEDLDSIGFSHRILGQSKSGEKEPTLDVVKLGLKWLANFHYTFLNHDLSACWSLGTYWHLDTRPDELAKMSDSPLKTAASAIDSKLKTAKYQTLLHGDAKIANFCFPASVQTLKEIDLQAENLAAVDFQYAGAGAGIKDLIYFLGSCFTHKNLSLHAEDLINAYFLFMRAVHRTYKKNIDIDDLENEWRKLYCFAWADFERFLQGWAPEHHKLTPYSKQQTQLALSRC